MQKNQNSKDSHGKGKPAPSGAFTHRIREDGERSICSCDTKKARDASPPPQDDLWVVVKNLSQQVAAQQAEMDALRNTIALQQKATANLEKILSNMASQAASTSEATQTALAAILARLEVKPVVPQVVVPNNKNYPPLPPTGATSKRKTVATKPNPTTTTATATTTTLLLLLANPLRTPDSLMLSKGDPLTNSWLNASPNFVKLVLLLGSLCWFDLLLWFG
ncbi:hypothetical protein BASA81_010225 [Batrachochytrium salamandrivorans]|nr:hypothetical protein BASA81_010225 [Batrachochytrium salamandrivorans]